MPIGVPELLIVLAIVLLIFGPRKLPDLGRSLGGGLRNFKREIKGEHDRPDLEPASDDDAVDGEVVPDRRS